MRKFNRMIDASGMRPRGIMFPRIRKGDIACEKETTIVALYLGTAHNAQNDHWSDKTRGIVAMSTVTSVTTLSG